MKEPTPVTPAQIEANRQQMMRRVANAILGNNGICPECLWEKPSCVCGRTAR